MEYVCIGLRAAAVLASLPFLAVCFYFMFAVSGLAREQKRSGGLLKWLFPVETAFFSRQPAVRARAWRLGSIWLFGVGAWLFFAAALLLAINVCVP